MIEFISILLICLVAVIAIAYAISFFWQVSFKICMEFAAFIVGIFLLFWISGLWENAGRHSWGILTPLLALMILLCYVAIKLGKKVWQITKKNLEKYKDQNH